jgi:phage terminase large subunit-like protein
VSRPLGMQWQAGVKADPETLPPSAVNTRTSLWPARWPAIAKQVCIDEVEAAPLEQQSEVKFNLPCASCELSSACLNAKRKEIGSLMYAREELTRPVSSESTMFPRDLFAPMLLRGEPLTQHWLKPYTFEHEYVVCQAWDIAWSERTGGDYLVCMTAYMHLVSHRRHLLDVQRWQRVSFDDQLKLMEERQQWWRADAVVIEGDAAQQVWGQSLRRNTAMPVITHDAGDKTNLAKGVPGLLILLENRRWEFPFGEGYHHDEVENWLNEMEAFQWVDGKLQGVGEHDDTVMCFWHLNWLMDNFTGPGIQEFAARIRGGRSM